MSGKSEKSKKQSEAKKKLEQATADLTGALLEHEKEEKESGDKIPINDSLLTKICDWIGALVTFLAMVPQGMLGMMLIHDLLKEAHPVLRLIADGIILLTGIFGKYVIVRYFNEETFKHLFSKLKEMIDIRNWSIGNAIRAWFAYIAVEVFGGLTLIAMDGCAEITDKYGVLKKYISPFLRNNYSKAVFLFSSGLANLLSAPGICFGAASVIEGELRSLFLDSSQERLAKEKLYGEIEAFRQWLNKLPKDRYESKFREIVNNIQGDHPELSTEKILELFQQNSLVAIKPFSKMHKFCNMLVPLIMVGIAITGFKNFDDFGAKSADAISNFTGVAFNVLNEAYKPSAMAFMTFMSIASVWSWAKGLVNMAFGYGRPAQIVRPHWNALLALCSALFCIIGAFPNAEQSRLAKEPMFLTIIALISPMLLESSPFYRKTILAYLHALQSCLCCCGGKAAERAKQAGHLLRRLFTDDALSAMATNPTGVLRITDGEEEEPQCNPAVVVLSGAVATTKAVLTTNVGDIASRCSDSCCGGKSHDKNEAEEQPSRQQIQTAPASSGVGTWASWFTAKKDAWLTFCGCKSGQQQDASSGEITTPFLVKTCS